MYTIQINKTTSTKDVQSYFSSLFPYLQIKFYSKAHEHFEGSQKKYEINDIVPISSLNGGMERCVFYFDSEYTVEEFETLFEEKLGLHVQVFRKSGDIYQQTTRTDHWTLEKQNKKGEEMEMFSQG